METERNGKQKSKRGNGGFCSCFFFKGGRGEEKKEKEEESRVKLPKFHARKLT